MLFFSFYDTPPQHCCCTWNVLLPGMGAGMFGARVQEHQASNLTSQCRPQKSFFSCSSQLPFLPNLPGLCGWDRGTEGTHCGTNIPSSIQRDSYTTAPVPSTGTV